MDEIRPPKRRSALRLRLGLAYYGLLRRLLWIKRRGEFSSRRQTEPLPYLCFAHKTPLRRRLKDVDMWMQENKIENLRLAVPRVDGLLLRPGETFSYWRLIGRPSKRRGFKKGMVLSFGRVSAGVGGGLCQLSNLIFWMTLHTPLTVLERHRHDYDVFPDADRTQPFGSGATCFYPHGDLMIQNNTPDTYQLFVTLGDECLEGEWRVSERPERSYAVVERGHEMRAEYWGGYTRRNELYRQCFGPDGELLSEELAVKNVAIMMYSPLVSDGKSSISHLLRP